MKDLMRVNGWRSFLMLAGGGLAWQLECAALAAAGSATATAEVVNSELKHLEDPTIFKRRAWLETEWNKFEAGSHTVEETLGGMWAWRVGEHQDWAVRLKLPYEWRVAGDAPGDSDDHGPGDLKLATGTAFRLNPNWRAGGGLELRMPTADPGLGDDVWRLQEIGAVAWDATTWLTLSPSFEYNQSVAEEPGAASQHYLEVFAPATFLLPDQWSVTARYEAKVNFHEDNYWTHSAKIQVARELTRIPLVCALSLKRTFDGGAKDFQVNFVLTWLFKSNQPAVESQP